jgi:hypothetical protein
MVHKEKLTLHAVESLPQIFLSLLQEITDCLSRISVILLEQLIGKSKYLGD